jgi:hypothetical protein
MHAFHQELKQISVNKKRKKKRVTRVSLEGCVEEQKKNKIFCLLHLKKIQSGSMMRVDSKMMRDILTRLENKGSLEYNFQELILTPIHFSLISHTPFLL